MQSASQPICGSSSTGHPERDCPPMTLKEHWAFLCLERFPILRRSCKTRIHAAGFSTAVLPFASRSCKLQRKRSEKPPPHRRQRVCSSSYASLAHREEYSTGGPDLLPGKFSELRQSYVE